MYIYMYIYIYIYTDVHVHIQIPLHIDSCVAPAMKTSQAGRWQEKPPAATMTASWRIVVLICVYIYIYIYDSTY